MTFKQEFKHLFEKPVVDFGVECDPELLVCIDCAEWVVPKGIVYPSTPDSPEEYDSVCSQCGGDRLCEEDETIEALFDEVKKLRGDEA